METSLQRVQRGAASRHSTENICEGVAVTVGVPDRVLIGAAILPGNLVAARRLLRANRRPSAELSAHIVRPAVFQ